MSIVSLLLGRKSQGKIDKIELDAVLRDNHAHRNEITGFPVEDGTEISDHIIKQPFRLTIDGFVTNSPVNLLGAAVNYIKGQGRERVKTALDELLILQNGEKDNDGNVVHKLITVVTGLKTYDNMAMVALTVPRDRNTGDALRFTAEFIEITTVSSEFIPAEKLQAIVDKQAAAKISRGKQTGADATTATKTRVSLAKRLVDKGRGLVEGFLK